MFYCLAFVSLVVYRSPAIRHHVKLSDKLSLTTFAVSDHLSAASFAAIGTSHRVLKHEVPAFLLIGIGAVLLFGAAGLTCWLLQTKRVVRERREVISVPHSCISLTPVAPPSWGIISTLDMMAPPKVSIIGTWDFVEDGEEGILRGFFLFYPGGGSHIEYTSGSSWSSRNFEYELKGCKALGTIEEHGEWNVTITTDGMKGKGKIGENQLHMSKRCENYQEAAEFYQGTWDMWMPRQATWVGFLTMNDNEGHLEFENGVSSSSWNCEVSGMFLRSAIPGQGPLSIEFAPDGSVGVATIGSTKYNIWRRCSSG